LTSWLFSDYFFMFQVACCTLMDVNIQKYLCKCNYDFILLPFSLKDYFLSDF